MVFILSLLRTFTFTCDESSYILGAILDEIISEDTSLAASPPRSMAPSINPRHPEAQSALANSIFPCLLWSASR